MNTNLELLSDRFSICRLAPGAPIPAWAAQPCEFISITRTAQELSIVCPYLAPPGDVQCERPWRALKVKGPLDFSLTGILASIAAPLAEAGISIFAISTYDTDYVLVKEQTLPEAIGALSNAGHTIT